MNETIERHTEYASQVAFYQRASQEYTVKIIETAPSRRQ